MISIPTIQTNIIGGSSSITFSSVSSLNSFISQAAVENLLLTGLTIYSPENFEQLSQPITLNRQEISGNASTKIVTPIVDVYQKTAILKGIDTGNFILDGLSSIGYNILANTSVQFILTVTPSIGSLTSYKEQTNAVDTFDIVANSGQIPESQMYEPEEVKHPSVMEQLLEINNQTSESIEVDHLEELTKPKVQPKTASKDKKEPVKTTSYQISFWFILAIVGISYILFDKDEV